MSIRHRAWLLALAFAVLAIPSGQAQPDTPRVEAMDFLHPDLIPIVDPHEQDFARVPLEVRVHCPGPASPFIARYANFSLVKLPDQVLGWIEPATVLPTSGPSACANAGIAWVFNTTLMLGANPSAVAMEPLPVELAVAVLDQTGALHGPYPFTATVQVELLPLARLAAGSEIFRSYDGAEAIGTVHVQNAANGAMRFAFDPTMFQRGRNYEIVSADRTLTLQSPNQATEVGTQGQFSVKVRLERPEIPEYVVRVPLEIIGTTTVEDPRAASYGGRVSLYFHVGEEPSPIPWPTPAMVLALAGAAAVLAARRR